MSRAREFADLAGSADAGGLTGRNIFENGAMQIFQRTGTSTSNGNLIDRHYTYQNAHSLTYETSRSTEVPSGQGFKYSYKTSATGGTFSANANYVMLRHIIEAQNVRHLAYGTSNAKKLTMSFWFKASARAGTLIVSFMHHGGGTQRQCSLEFTYNTANTWQKLEATLPADTGVAIGNSDAEAGLFFDIMFAKPTNWSSASTLNTAWQNNETTERAVGQTDFLQANGDDIYITGIQLEVGEKATEFEHIPFSTELRTCQRYYQKSYSYGTAPGTATTSGAAIGSRANGLWDMHTRLPVPMRGSPTVTVYSSTGTSGKVRNAATGSDETGSANTIGETGFNVNGASSTMDHGALHQYVAKAELS